MNTPHVDEQFLLWLYASFSGDSFVSATEY